MGLAIGQALGLPFLRCTGAAAWSPPVTVTTQDEVQWLNRRINGRYFEDRLHTGDDRTASGGPGLQQGQCLDLDGVNQYVDVSASADWQITGDGAISFWARSGTVHSSKEHAVGLGNGASDNVQFDFNESGAGIWVYWASGGATKIAAGSAGDYTDTKWHHLVLTRTGTTVTLYIDDASVGTLTNSDNIGGNDALVFGRRAGASLPYYWNGNIMDVRWWNGSGLSADNVTHLYNWGRSGTSPGLSNLKGWWHLDEQSGPTAYDCSGNGNDGTLVNSPNYITQDVYSWQNMVGYYLNGAVYVPRDESNVTKDVLGNALTYTGTAPRHGKWIKSYCAGVPGTTEYGSVSHHADFNMSANNAFTIAFKCNLDSLGNNRYFIDKQGSFAGLYVTQTSTGGINVALPDGSGWNEQAFLSVLTTGIEVSIVITYDGTTLSLYKDGTLFGTVTDVRTLADNLQAITFAGRSSGYAVLGNVWDYRISQDAVTAAGALWISTDGSLGNDPDMTTFSGWWPMAEGSGAVFHNVLANEHHGTWFNSPNLSATQDDFHYNLNYGFTDLAGVHVPAFISGATDADGNAITNPAVDGWNGAETQCNFDPWQIPALSVTTISYEMPHAFDFVKDDLQTPSQHWALRADHGVQEEHFWVYAAPVTDSTDRAAIHAYRGSVDFINSVTAVLLPMDALTGSGPQTTADEFGVMDLDGGSMDAETTVTPAKRGNAIEIIDTGGSADGTLTATAPAGLNLNAAISFYGWIKISGSPTGQDPFILDQNIGAWKIEITAADDYLVMTYNGTTITDAQAFGTSGFRFVVSARDADGNHAFWSDGRYIGKAAATMTSGLGTIKLFEDGSCGLVTGYFDEVGFTDTTRLRDGDIEFLYHQGTGKFLNKTTNLYEA